MNQLERITRCAQCTKKLYLSANETYSCRMYEPKIVFCYGIKECPKIIYKKVTQI